MVSRRVQKIVDVMSFQSSIIDKIKDTLNSKGMTQKDFAEQLGISQARVSQILNASEGVRLETIVGLVSELGMSMEITYTNHDADVVKTGE